MTDSTLGDANSLKKNLTDELMGFKSHWIFEKYNMYFIHVIW